MNASEAIDSGACESTPGRDGPSGPPRRPSAGLGGWALVGVIAATSAALGWTAGVERGERRAGELAPGAAPGGAAVVLVQASFDGSDTATAAARAPAPTEPPLAAAAAPVPPPAELVGALKADLLTLRALYRRLAEVAELDGGEFDVDFESDLASGDGEPLGALDPAAPDALGVLIDRIDPMLERSAAMERVFVERRREYDARVSGRPVDGARISSGFGERTDPLTGRRVAHRGLDYVGRVGEPVRALAAGVVTFAGTNGGYGRLVEIEHADGFSTRYAHNDTVLVALGARVDKGETVATLGNSGRSTGPHLHLEVRRDGVATDPRFFVR